MLLSSLTAGCLQFRAPVLSHEGSCCSSCGPGGWSPRVARLFSHPKVSGWIFPERFTTPVFFVPIDLRCVGQLGNHLDAKAVRLRSTTPYLTAGLRSTSVVSVFRTFVLPSVEQDPNLSLSSFAKLGVCSTRYLFVLKEARLRHLPEHTRALPF